MQEREFDENLIVASAVPLVSWAPGCLGPLDAVGPWMSWGPVPCTVCTLFMIATSLLTTFLIERKDLPQFHLCSLCSDNYRDLHPKTTHHFNQVRCYDRVLTNQSITRQ